MNATPLMTSCQERWIQECLQGLAMLSECESDSECVRVRVRVSECIRVLGGEELLDSPAFQFYVEIGLHRCASATAIEAQNQFYREIERVYARVRVSFFCLSQFYRGIDLRAHLSQSTHARASQFLHKIESSTALTPLQHPTL